MLPMLMSAVLFVASQDTITVDLEQAVPGPPKNRLDKKE